MSKTQEELFFDIKHTVLIYSTLAQMGYIDVDDKWMLVALS